MSASSADRATDAQGQMDELVRTNAPAAFRTQSDAQSQTNDGLRVAIELRRGAFTLRAAFHAPPGLTVLLGPSGAGKSLTLHAIAGLAPVAAGRITLDGHALVDVAAGVALPARRRRVGYVPQSYALFPHLSVADNIAYGLPARLQRPAPWDRAAQEERAERVAVLLRLARLPGYEARRPAQLSGGEAQRVALARALAAEPAALLLDEPLSALDTPTRATVRDDLRALVAASGAPAILVTHDLAEARALGDRIVALVGGRVVAEGPLAATLARPPSATAARLFGWQTILPVTRAIAAPVTLVTPVTPVTPNMQVTLTTGQTLAIPIADAPTGDSRQLSSDDAQQAARGLALALRAERLTLQSAHENGANVPPTQSATPTDHATPASTDLALTVTGVLSRVADEGAYIRMTVALGDAPTVAANQGALRPPTHGETGAGEDPATVAPCVVTCSPREWAALGLAVGARVCVRVAPDAARLVVADE